MISLAAHFADPWTPPAAPRSLLEWSLATLRIAEGAQAEAARAAGLPPPPWEPTPVQRAVLAAYDGPQQWIAVLGDRQGGKTLSAIVAPLLYQLAEDRRPVLLAGPRDDDCSDLMRGKAWPTHDASGLTLLPQLGTGARGGIAESMLSSTGVRLYLRGAGGSNQAQQAMVTARAVLVTELDSIALAARTRRRADGDPGAQKLELLAGRADDFQEAARIVVESTIKMDHNSLIETQWLGGTRGQVMIPCPACGEYVARDPAHLKYDPESDYTAGASAVLACPHCGACSTAEDSAAAAWQGVVVCAGQSIIDGQVVGPLPATACWSVRSGALENPRKSLGWLATLHRRAQAAIDEREDHEPMRLLVRDQWARRYVPEASEARPELTPQSLAIRSRESGYALGELPFPGTVSLGIDVQLRELWWMVIVLEAGGDRVAIIDGGVEYICGRFEEPTKEQRVRSVLGMLSRARHRGWPGADGRQAVTQIEGVDLGGGGWLSEIDAALKEDRWKCWGVRGGGDSVLARHDGQATHQRVLGQVETYRRYDGRKCAMISDGPKDRIVKGLTLDPAAPMAVLLPRGIDAISQMAKHLCAEQRGADGEWARRGPRWDLQDAGVYAIGLALLHREGGLAGGSDAGVVFA